MNNRIQVFDAVGRNEARFLREIAVLGKSQHGTAFNVAFSPRGDFMFVVDGDNNRIWTVDLKAWEVVDTFKVSADNAPDAVLHKIATDRAGNLLVARTTVGVFRFNFTGVT
jgi:DNA-binding beta-propeller fold protein YncE